jgi:hypothetical protein
MKICCEKLSFDTLGCAIRSSLVKVPFISTTWVFDFIVGKEGQNGGQCSFLCKKCIIHLDNGLQQLQINNVSKFSRFKFQLP